MRQYIDAINKLYESDLTPLEEALGSASEFEIDAILESMNQDELMQFGRKILEFHDISDEQQGILSKIAASVFGKSWEADRIGKLHALKDKENFHTQWNAYSKRFNRKLTVDNLKSFLKDSFDMSPQTAEKALAEVKPKVDPRTKEIKNIDDMIPALAYQYVLGVGDALEKRAEEKKIDIDALGYDDLPNNDSDYQAAPAAAKSVAGEPAQGQPPAAGDPGSMSANQISTKMGKTLGSLHVSADQRQQAMNDAKKGFNQSFSKNSRTLAAIGYSYLKAIGAS